MEWRYPENAPTEKQLADGGCELVSYFGACHEGAGWKRGRISAEDDSVLDEVLHVLRSTVLSRDQMTSRASYSDEDT